MIYLGNTKLGEIYLGSTKIAQAYLGSTQIYQYTQPVYQYPYLLIEFIESSYVPSTNLLYSAYRDYCHWSRVSSSPNVWKLEIHDWNVPQPTSNWGVDFLFCANVTSYTGSLTMPCKLVGSGNFDMDLGGHYCLSMDRMFTNCTGLTYIEPIQCTTVQNVGGMFQGCTNVEEGALAQYNWFDTYGVNITNHSGTFTDCGSNTQTGLDELDQIPTGWGGNMAPPASYIGGSRMKIYSNYDAWSFGTGWDPHPFANPYGMSLFTQVSVSSYAGVSMNRSRIKAINGLGTASGNALYFYPCLANFSGTGSSARITGCYTTTGYNGMLTSSQGNTDMPGTLDYSTFGTFAHSYGTYDADSAVFIFLVTNVPIDQWGGLSDAYGVLYNGNFRNTDFWYFF